MGSVRSGGWQGECEEWRLAGGGRRVGGKAERKDTFFPILHPSPFFSVYIS